MVSLDTTISTGSISHADNIDVLPYQTTQTAKGRILVSGLIASPIHFSQQLRCKPVHRQERPQQVVHCPYLMLTPPDAIVHGRQGKSAWIYLIANSCDVLLSTYVSSPCVMEAIMGTATTYGVSRYRLYESVVTKFGGVFRHAKCTPDFRTPKNLKIDKL